MQFFKNIQLGIFLGMRELRRANKWTTFLIITIMVLTYLNLVVVGGLLVGIIEGSVQANRKYYTGDILISKLKTKDHIINSQELIRYAKSLPEVLHVSPRYIGTGNFEANYKDRKGRNEVIDSTAGILTGVNVESEIGISQLNERIVEGRFLRQDDFDKVVMGANLLFTYTPIDNPTFSPLKDVGVGDKVRMTINGNQREVEIIGVLKTKAGEVDQRVFVPDTYLRRLLNRVDLNVDEIAIEVKQHDWQIIQGVKQKLLDAGFGEFAIIQDSEESLPKFLNDIKVTFNLLGIIVGAIGVAVASITIFIVIFINAISRRRSIGILKGIGIKSSVIEVSYVFQAVFYSIIGSSLGLLLILYVLVPYFERNPINFPFSEGILAVTAEGILIRLAIVLVVTILAGFIPARLITRQNTLNAILGR